MTKRTLRVLRRAATAALFNRYVPMLIGSLVVACSKTNVVVPADGSTQGKAAHAGVTMFAEPNCWSWDPSDLADFMTPIWIYLVNRRSDDIRIVYEDFSLTDPAGTRFAAISPYPTYLQSSKSQSTLGISSAYPAERTAHLPDARVDSQTVEWWLDTPANRAAAEGDPRYRDTTQARDLGGNVKTLLVRGARRGGHAGGRVGGHATGLRNGGFHGRAGYGGAYSGGHFYGHPYHSGYYPLYTPWPYYYAGPPHYGSYVYVWGDHYYPTSPSEDVVHYGLPEGVLHAGGAVAGFVYFQNATARTTHLDMTWTVHTKDGKDIAKLAIPLRVVED